MTDDVRAMREEMRALTDEVRRLQEDAAASGGSQAGAGTDPPVSRGRGPQAEAAASRGRGPQDGGRTRKRRPAAAKSRIAAVGIGVAAMAALVANMELAGSHAQTADAAPKPAPKKAAKVKQPHPNVLERTVVARSTKPIVLTPHTRVHTVAAPAPSYSYAAPAAPVASSGGSRP